MRIRLGYTSLHGIARFGAEVCRMRVIQVRSLLGDLWQTVEDNGGKPSENMIFDMARRAGAKFDDKFAHAVLVDMRECRGEEA